MKVFRKHSNTDSNTKLVKFSVRGLPNPHSYKGGILLSEDLLEIIIIHYSLTQQSRCRPLNTMRSHVAGVSEAKCHHYH